MFLALDKVERQGLSKAIIAVPEISIGGSFADTNLSKFGFFADWHIDARYNLCTAGEAGKVDKLLEFLNDCAAKYLLCTHAFLYQQRIHISLTDKNGTTYHPEEWFAVDRDTAVAICEKIVDGTITQYRMMTSDPIRYTRKLRNVTKKICTNFRMTFNFYSLTISQQCGFL